MGSTPPHFLVDTLPNSDTATLTGDEARHAATVRRIRPGESLVLSDGAGSAAHCVVETVQAGRDAQLRLTVRDRWQDPAPALRVIVAQALVKGDRGELAVELATEAGADAIVPWRASRSVARWDDGQRGSKALARWRATARSATKQARRCWLPEVSAPLDTTGLAELVRESATTLLLDSDAEQGIGDVNLPAQGDLVLVVGPEGGIAAEECDVLISAGAEPVRLGPFVLRTSTAAAVALGALGVRTQRWT